MSSQGNNDELPQILGVDNMLFHVGDFGRYQKRLLVLFSLINILSAYHYFGQTFISVIPKFKCQVANITNLQETDITQCYITEQNEHKTIVKPCENWNYTSDYGYVSIVQEFDWICNNDWKPVMGQSVYFVGSVIGSLGFGVMADAIGRLHALVAANLAALIGNTITLFSKDAITFAISRFLAGAATDANFVMMYIIVMEYMRPSMRTTGLNLTIGIFYCFASVLVPWTAIYLHSWKYFLLSFTVPHVVVLFFYFMVPESAQWLISKDRIDDAISCFQRIAMVNRKEVSLDAIQGLRNYAQAHIRQPKYHESFIGLLRTRKLRRKTLILIFKSMVMTLGYDAIARNVNGFDVSPFIIFSATSATILPGCLFILAMQDRIGRKAMASGSLLISGVFMTCIGFLLSISSNINPYATLTLIVVARLGTIVAYNSGAQYAVELIPTVVRGQGVSVIHVAGHAATFFSPQILYLSTLWKPLPEVTLGILLTLGAFACLFLPETLHKTLPVTLEDGEAFGEGEKMFEFAFNKKQNISTLTLNKNES